MDGWEMKGLPRDFKHWQEIKQLFFLRLEKFQARYKLLI